MTRAEAIDAVFGYLHDADGRQRSIHREWNGLGIRFFYAQGGFVYAVAYREGRYSADNGVFAVTPFFDGENAVPVEFITNDGIIYTFSPIPFDVEGMTDTEQVTSALFDDVLPKTIAQIVRGQE